MDPGTLCIKYVGWLIHTNILSSIQTSKCHWKTFLAAERLPYYMMQTSWFLYKYVQQSHLTNKTSHTLIFNSPAKLEFIWRTGGFLSKYLHRFIYPLILDDSLKRRQAFWVVGFHSKIDHHNMYKSSILYIRTISSMLHRFMYAR